jgi:hypothetical protein
MLPDRAWIDTGVIVHEGDRLFLTASGAVLWAVRNRTAGPDGIEGYPGWNVGAGGLIGRINGMHMFDIGARSQMFLMRGSLRHHTYYRPPPVRMPANGQLELGFKDFTQGSNHGEFEITIRRPQ